MKDNNKKLAYSAPSAQVVALQTESSWETRFLSFG